MDTDFIVVGGSFAGLSAALQLARTRRRIVVIDAGLPRNRYASAAHGFLGHDGSAPGAIMATGREQLLAYPSARLQRGVALSAVRIAGGFAVELDSGEQLTCKRLILATGVIDNLPVLPGVAERWGQSVLHCPYCHGYEVAGKRLGVIGVGPMSAHAAVLIADWSLDMTYFANGTAVDDEQAAALAARGVVVEHTPVAALDGPVPALDAVVLADGRRIPMDAVFVASQVSMASPLARQLGCAFEQGPLGEFVSTDQCQATTVAGVYAAGDMARMPPC